MRWTNPRHTKIPPPLLFNGRLVSEQAERAEILRDSLLARFEASDDLPDPTITTDSRIPWTMELKDIEVRNCTIGSGNTSPGPDGISVDLLTACWKTIGPIDSHLFRACLRLGYHPLCFKLAEVVFIPKADGDPSLSYRASEKEWKGLFWKERERERKK